MYISDTLFQFNNITFTLSEEKCGNATVENGFHTTYCTQT